MLLDARCPLAADDAFVDGMILVSLNVSDRAVFEVDLDATAAGAHVACSCFDLVPGLDLGINGRLGHDSLCGGTGGECKYRHKRACLHRSSLVLSVASAEQPISSLESFLASVICGKYRLDRGGFFRRQSVRLCFDFPSTPAATNLLLCRFLVD